MKKIRIIPILLTCFFMSSAIVQAADPVSLSAEDTLPVSLSEALILADIDISEMKLATLPGGISFASAGPPEALQILLAGPDGRGLLLLPELSVLIRFDMVEERYSATQLSEECIQQLSATLQALVSTVYNCAAVPSVLTCILNVIDLLTDLYLIPLNCNLEPPDERAF